MVSLFGFCLKKKYVVICGVFGKLILAFGEEGPRPSSSSLDVKKDLPKRRVSLFVCWLAC